MRGRRFVSEPVVTHVYRSRSAAMEAVCSGVLSLQQASAVCPRSRRREASKSRVMVVEQEKTESGGGP